MFRLVILLTLFAQSWQMFVCCQDCCADSCVPAASKSEPCCGHDHGSTDHTGGDQHHEDDPAPADPGHQDSHHLCTATHVFFVRDSRKFSNSAVELVALALPVTTVDWRLSPSGLCLTVAPGAASPVRAPDPRAVIGVYQL